MLQKFMLNIHFTSLQPNFCKNNLCNFFMLQFECKVQNVVLKPQIYTIKTLHLCKLILFTLRVKRNFFVLIFGQHLTLRKLMFRVYVCSFTNWMAFLIDRQIYTTTNLLLSQNICMFFERCSACFNVTLIFRVFPMTYRSYCV